ncbi:hypothetical protein [Nocardia jinanensis]|nr:hypothetical protein [Nocardia jinanensis]
MRTVSGCAAIPASGPAETGQRARGGPSAWLPRTRAARGDADDKEQHE